MGGQKCYHNIKSEDFPSAKAAVMEFKACRNQGGRLPLLFNSFEFALFLPIVFLAYWGMPAKFRTFWLLIASYYFYMSWNPKYVVLILGTTAISYAAGIMLEKTGEPKKKKLIIFFTALACFGVLFFFKYFNFFSREACAFLSLFGIKLHPLVVKVLLPVGISFYTFQTLSYVIDIYRGRVGAEKNFFVYATFISFFPQLVAGPIERTSNLLPQIKTPSPFSYEQATYGLKLMAWGFFKKLVIADTLAVYVDKVYAHPHGFGGFSLFLAIFFFTVQIYCDFSGYSDIAIGTAKLLGINLMTNFSSPYLSASIKEFWSRWHISLSTWFRDYLYIPLGGNRVSRWQHYFNLLATFLASGLWHGANTTFIVWGGVHGLAQVAENAVVEFFGNKPEGKCWTLLKTLLVFIFCMLAWNFFRAKTFGDAVYIFRHMLDGVGAGKAYLVAGIKALGIGKMRCLIVFSSVLLLLLYDLASLKTDVLDLISRQHIVLRHFIYLALIFAILLFRASGEVAFVYFQF